MVLVLASGCEVRALIGSNYTSGQVDTGSDGTTGSTGAIGSTDSGAATTGGDATSSHTDGPIFDVGIVDAPGACTPKMWPSCDQYDADPWHALGLNCPGGPVVEGSFDGDPAAMVVFRGTMGDSGVYAPREGERFVILSSGEAAKVPRTPAQLQADDPDCVPLACPSTQMSTDIRTVLPPPIDVRRVSDTESCASDPDLIGTGDCSNSLWQQWIAGGGAVDYAELRMTAKVPDDIDGLAYDFAFFSVEYPLWVDHASSYNDMYLAWLESESWTGNISFDEQDSPIAVTSVFLDYKDAPSSECPAPCAAPELHGFSMEGHGGTKWLTTTAPVVSGEQIELVFAIFDMSDGIYDSAVILDHFQWTCSGLPPATAPTG